MVAAHAMTRALFASYSGKLFQVTRASDSQTKDIGVASTGGQVDLTTLSSFCSATTCRISVLYDQTGNANDLRQSVQANMPTVGYWTTTGGTQLPYCLTKNAGGPVPQGGQYLRNRAATHKIPTGSASQTEYMVVHASIYGGHCCYDYGNMENYVGDDGPGTMTALYFGNTRDWTVGAGNGPWGMMDMENGVFSAGGAIQNPGGGVNSNDPSISYPSPNIASILGKTNGTSTFALKVGDAAHGSLTTVWNGSLPTSSNPTPYIPLHQEGGLSLGEGGDGSDDVDGAFSEGVVIASETTDATDNAIQTNLNAVFSR